MPKSAIPGSYGNCMLTWIINCQTWHVFAIQLLAILVSIRRCHLKSLYPFVCSDVFLWPQFACPEWIMMLNIFFMCLWVMCISSSVKFLFKSFTHFLFGLIFAVEFWRRWILIYVCEVQTLSSDLQWDKMEENERQEGTTGQRGWWHATGVVTLFWGMAG